jgi:hypothetical protein
MRLLYPVLALAAAIGSSDWPTWSIEPGSVLKLESGGAAHEARVTHTRDLVHYSLYVIETDKEPLCGLSNGKPAAAVPLAGRWNERSEWSPGGLTLACVNGAIGKCVAWGYRPWEPGMRAFHQACIRMVRADYCGDGAGQTLEGTPIDIWDTKGIAARDAVPGMRLEAEWAPDGAVRIRTTRFPFGMDHVLRNCRHRLDPRNGERSFLANSSYPN